MKILHIEDTFLNIDNITHLHITDTENNIVRIEAEGSDWHGYSYIKDCAAKEVITVLTKCLDNPNKTIIKLDSEVRILQRELEERRARIDASLRDYI